MRLLVVGLERLQDLLRLVDEVEDEGVLLARVGAVEPREGLHGLDAREPLVHVHRVQQRLVEAGLVLLGDDQHLVLVGRRTAPAAPSPGCRCSCPTSV